MLAGKLSIHLKPNTLTEFSQTLDQQVVPLLPKLPKQKLPKQKGFKDEIIFATPGATDLLAISFWDDKQDAEADNKQDAEAYDASNLQRHPEDARQVDRGDIESRDDRGSVLDITQGQLGCASGGLTCGLPFPAGRGGHAVVILQNT